MPGQHEETGEIPEKVFQLGFEAKIGVCQALREQESGWADISSTKTKAGRTGDCEELEAHPGGWREGYTGLLGAADGPTVGSGL